MTPHNASLSVSGHRFIDIAFIGDYGEMLAPCVMICEMEQIGIARVLKAN